MAPLQTTPVPPIPTTSFWSRTNHELCSLIRVVYLRSFLGPYFRSPLSGLLNELRHPWTVPPVERDPFWQSLDRRNGIGNVDGDAAPAQRSVGDVEFAIRFRECGIHPHAAGGNDRIVAHQARYELYRSGRCPGLR